MQTGSPHTCHASVDAACCAPIPPLRARARIQQLSWEGGRCVTSPFLTQQPLVRRTFYVNKRTRESSWDAGTNRGYRPLATLWPHSVVAHNAQSRAPMLIHKAQTFGHGPGLSAHGTATLTTLTACSIAELSTTPTLAGGLVHRWIKVEGRAKSGGRPYYYHSFTKVASLPELSADAISSGPPHIPCCSNVAGHPETGGAMG